VKSGSPALGSVSGVDRIAAANPEHSLMILTRQLRAPLKLEPDEVRQALRQLASTGWTPAVLESERAFLALAGLDEDVPWLRRQTVSAARLRSGVSTGDIFFRDEGLFYFISMGDGRTVVFDQIEYVVEESVDPFVELGAIGEDANILNDGLAQLAEALESALRDTLDGRRVRHMKFDWAPPPASTTRLSELRASEIGDDEAPAFKPAILDDSEVRAADVLADALTREIVREISRAGFARERDLKTRWTQRQRGDDAATSIREARDAGVLATEYLLECRNTGDQILRLAAPEKLVEGGHGDLVHASCGRTFHQEDMSEGYTLSDLGQRLVQKSNWMTVWVTERLRRVGVPTDAILWNVSESGEEIDILLEFLEEVWIFELKDRTFSAGDAYPFNYRRARYGAEKAFIITTDHVAADAKRVFDELSEQSRRTSRVLRPIYIEGLESVESELERNVARSAANFAARLLQPLSVSTNFDLRRLVEERTAGLRRAKRAVSRPPRKNGSKLLVSELKRPSK
jgi:hypothetical protein